MDFGKGRYLAMVLLCVVASTYTSYHGIKSATGLGIGMVFAAVLAIALFSLNVSFSREKTRDGHIRSTTVLIFLFPLFFSTASNFNYFFSSYMKKNEARATYDDAYSEYLQNMQTLRQIASQDEEATDYEGRRKQLGLEFDRLQAQIRDSNAPGFGAKALSHMNTIELVLQKPITRLRVPGVKTDESRNQDFFDSYKKMVESAFLKGKSQRIFDLEELVGDISAAMSASSQTNRTAKSRSADLASNVDGFKSEVGEYKTEAIRLNLPVQDVVSRISSEDAELGEIMYSLHSGFVEWRNPVSTVLCLLFSLFLDLMPLFVVIGSRTSESDRYVNNQDHKRVRPISIDKRA